LGPLLRPPAGFRRCFSGHIRISLPRGPSRLWPASCSHMMAAWLRPARACSPQESLQGPPVHGEGGAPAVGVLLHMLPRDGSGAG